MGIKTLLRKYNIITSHELGLETRKTIRDTKSGIFDNFTDGEEKIEKINEYGLSQKEADTLLEEMLLYRRISDGSFLYFRDKHDKEGKENGAVKFSAVANAPLYKEKINDNEEEMFKDNTLGAMISGMSRNRTTHIELWPESWKKFIEYSDEWDPEHDNLRGKKYIGIDVSGVYVDMANKNVEKIGMVCESVPGDRFKHSIFDTVENQMYYFFGGSISNLEVWSATEIYYQDNKKTIINLLKRMKSNHPFTTVPAVITYFEAPNKQDPKYKDMVDKLRATYGAKDTPYYDPWTHAAISDFILSGFEALGLDRSKLELVVEYDDRSNPAAIKVGATFTEKTEIQIGKYNKVVKEAGQHIRAIKSQRFTKEMFQEIATDAWFIVKQQKSRDGVAVAVLQSKLWINDKFKKARNIWYGILIWATLLSWWMLTKNILHNKEIQKHQQKIDSDFASNQQLIFYANDHGYYEIKTEKEKIEYINKLVDQIFENISVRYNIQTDEDEIKKMIKIYIKDDKILWKFSNTSNYANNVFSIGNAFTQKYSDILVEKDINQMPYDHLKDFEEYFKDVILDSNMWDENLVRLSGAQGTSMKEDTYIPDPTNGEIRYPYGIDFLCVKNWTKMELKEIKTMAVESENDAKIRRYINNDYKIQSHCVRNGYLYVKRREQKPYNYIIPLSNRKNTHPRVMAYDYFYQISNRKNIHPSIIAYDYFYQNRPVIHEVYQKFAAIYMNLTWNHDREKNQTYNWKKDAIKMLLTKDLLQTWLLDHIEKDNHKDIMAYLEGFIQRNASALQNQWIALVPYDNYTTEYKESCKNTREANENNIPTKIIYEERQEYDFHYIGKYYSKSGKEYDVAEVRIEGNTYIFAKNVSEDKDTYRTEEWIDITLVNYYLYVERK